MAGVKPLGARCTRAPSALAAKTMALAALILSTLAAAEPSWEPAPGHITGQVRYTGPLPPPRDIVTNDGSVLRESLLDVDAKTKGLRHVGVWLKGELPKSSVGTLAPVVIDQKDWRFSPRVVFAVEGQEVRFENSDNVNHSVQAESAAPANRFNAIAAPGQPIRVRFRNQSRPIAIGCSLHPWMRSWVYVTSHRYCAVTDERGRFAIRKVPPGTYDLLAEHPDSGLQERTRIQLASGEERCVVVEWDRLPAPGSR
ncbi:MAG: hypothetical protein C4296_00470 [Gemmataceae bacterium]